MEAVIMNKKYKQILYSVLAAVMLILTIISFTLSSMGIQPVIINLFSYLIPFAVLILTLDDIRMGKERKGKPYVVTSALIIAMFFVMCLNVFIVAGFRNSNYNNAFGNIPIMYFPFVIIALVFWIIFRTRAPKRADEVKTESRKEEIAETVTSQSLRMVDKLLIYIPLGITIAIIVACVVGLFIPTGGSAPTWVNSLIFAVIGLIPLAASVIILLLVRFIIKRKLTPDSTEYIIGNDENAAVMPDIQNDKIDG